MQPLHQEIDPVPTEMIPHNHPVLQGLMADQTAAYAEEVRLLRQRVAVLESALAAAKAAPMGAPTTGNGATAPTAASPTIIASEFSEPVAPAVVAYSPESAATVQSPAATAASADAPAMADRAFATAWSDEEDSSFEERIAQKAFFQVGSVDEQSRNWLLTS